MRLPLRPATTAKAVATSLSQIGGKAKGSFQGFRVKDLPHAFDSLSSKPFIARQSKRSLPAAAAAPRPRRRLHSRSTVDRSTTMLLLYYTSSNTQWRLFNKIGDRIKSFGFASAEFPLFGGLKTFLILEKRPLQLNNLSHD